MGVSLGLGLIALITRIGQALACLVVIGITGQYVRFAVKNDATTGHLARFIFTLGVSGISLVFAVIWALPFSSNFQNWGYDLGVVLAYGAALAWMWFYRNKACGGKVTEGFSNSIDDNGFKSHEAVTKENYCSKMQANNAFIIIAMALFLITAIVGYLAVKKTRRGGGKGVKKGGKIRR